MVPPYAHWIVCFFNVRCLFLADSHSTLHLAYVLLHDVHVALQLHEDGDGGVELLLAEVAQRITAVGKTVDVELLMKIELADKLGYVCQHLVGGVGVNLAENGGHLVAVVTIVLAEDGCDVPDEIVGREGPDLLLVWRGLDVYRITGVGETLDIVVGALAHSYLEGFAQFVDDSLEALAQFLRQMGMNEFGGGGAGEELRHLGVIGVLVHAGSSVPYIHVDEFPVLGEIAV